MHTLGEMAAHPHTAASGLIQEYEHPAYGVLKAIAQPLKLHGERLDLGTAPPLFAQHTREILLEAGYAADELDRLEASKVITTGRWTS